MVSATILGGVVLSIGSVLAVLWVAYYTAERDSIRAARRTLSNVIELAVGVVVAGIVLAGEILASLGDVVLLALDAPGLIGHAVLGLLGYLTISGVLSLNPITWGIIALVVTATFLALNERRELDALSR